MENTMRNKSLSENNLKSKSGPADQNGRGLSPSLLHSHCVGLWLWLSRLGKSPG